MKSIDELIGHVRNLITECNKKEFNEVSKHIESLNELSKYKNMEDKKTSSMETKLTIYFVICLIYSLYSLLSYKYEYHAYMKDKELSNDLKKTFYQGKINRILKNK